MGNTVMSMNMKISIEKLIIVNNSKTEGKSYLRVRYGLEHEIYAI